MKGIITILLLITLISNCFSVCIPSREVTTACKVIKKRPYCIGKGLICECGCR